ncbi:MAG: DUF2817 domain-containing protein [Phycisphaerales bacterium JB040]
MKAFPSLLALLALALLTACEATVVSSGRVGEPFPELESSSPARGIGADPVLLAADLEGGFVIGRSVRGNPIRALDFGDFTQSAPRLYVIALIHASEPEGYRTLPDVLPALRSAARSAGLRVRLVPTMNPDGMGAGSRENANGVDLNRNFPASNFSASASRGQTPLDQPETEAVARDIRRFQPDLLIVLHSIASGPFVNLDGPDTPTIDYAATFAAAATAGDGRHTWTVKPSMGYPTPGSLGSWAGIDLGIPTLTIEYRRGHDPDAASRATGSAVRAIAAHLARHQQRARPPVPAGEPLAN